MLFFVLNVKNDRLDATLIFILFYFLGGGGGGGGGQSIQV